MALALKDRSDVSRTFWEWSPEEGGLLQLRTPLRSLQHTSSQNLPGHPSLRLNLDLGCIQCSQSLGPPCEPCPPPHALFPGDLPQFPCLRFAKPVLSCVRPLVGGLGYELWAGSCPHLKCRAEVLRAWPWWQEAGTKCRRPSLV